MTVRQRRKLSTKASGEQYVCIYYIDGLSRYNRLLIKWGGANSNCANGVVEHLVLTYGGWRGNPFG